MELEEEQATALSEAYLQLTTVLVEPHSSPSYLQVSFFSWLALSLHLGLCMGSIRHLNGLLRGKCCGIGISLHRMA